MASEILTKFIGFFSSNCYCFSLIGKLYCLYLAYKLIAKVWHWTKLYLLSPSLSLAVDVKSSGKWAVVTGATDGIGKGYAKLLATKGMNVVLVSRSMEKLNNVAKEIADKGCTSEIKCVVADFTDINIYNKIEEEIKDLDIGVLVNNVGMSYDHPDYLETLSSQKIKDVIVVNCFSVAFMTGLVLPKMAEKKKGIIINISSISAHIPTPFLTLYSATKSFVHRFSMSLEQEYKSKGIVIQCVSPGFVATKLAKIKKSSFMVPDPDSFASSALATVGLKNHVYGWFAHDLEKSVLDCMCERMSNSIIYNSMFKVRAKGLAKKKSD